MVKTILLLLAGLALFLPGPAAFCQDPVTDAYTIGPGDLLAVNVWKEPDLTMEVTVLPDGRINFPLVGEVTAQGLTLGAVKDLLTQGLARFLSAPDVTVILKESKRRRIYTLGRLLRPGPYPLDPGMTVLQALSVAGGFAEWADTKNIHILRYDNGREERLKFNYNDFLSGKGEERNLALRPGDIIVVP
ncbi:MAG: polysaccharide biosynthesis/export family protein [Thermodesulfobacteriota bacterium]